MTTKDLILKLNARDEQIILDEKRKKVEEFYKQKKIPGIVAELNSEMVKDLESFSKFMSKPGAPNACLILRKTMLHHLDEASPIQAMTLESYMKHFECL